MQLAASTSRPALGWPLQRRGCRRPCRVVAGIAEILEQGAASPAVEVPLGLNKYSSKVTQPKSQGASQAMLYATGLTPEDMNKPQVWMAVCVLSEPGGAITCLSKRWVHAAARLGHAVVGS